MLSLCCVRVFQPQLEVARVAVALHPSQRRRRPLAAVRGAHAPRHVGSGREHQSAERRGTTASRTRPPGSPARRHEHPHAVLPREYRVCVFRVSTCLHESPLCRSSTRVCCCPCTPLSGAASTRLRGRRACRSSRTASSAIAATNTCNTIKLRRNPTVARSCNNNCT